MQSNPERMSRDRYSRSFQSSIFEPAPAQEASFNPAGKRRDQTTQEMFGSYNEKDLRAATKTFVPKEESVTAREKKQQFLQSSECLAPCPRPGAGHHLEANSRPNGPPSEAGYVHQTRAAFDPYAEDEVPDSNMRRQEQLKSKLFGRATPAATAESRGGRLMPSDGQWHSTAEGRSSGEGATCGDRAYQEKCSTMFDRHSPQRRPEWTETQRQQQEEESQGDQRRRGNAHYSDLFGRAAPDDEAGPPSETWRPRAHGGAEEKIIVHQDWTNSKTELMHSRGSRPEEPHLRKHEELHNDSVFGGGSGGRRQCAERLDPVTHDNSGKLREALGRGTQQTHQAHLRSSMAPNSFYDEAQEAQHWEVAELHLSGLHRTADDEYVRELCQGFDLQLVKVAAEVDPVRNLCKGRAKVMVRYNPRRDAVQDLVRKCENSNLKVEM